MKTRREARAQAWDAVLKHRSENPTESFMGALPNDEDRRQYFERWGNEPPPRYEPVSGREPNRAWNYGRPTICGDCGAAVYDTDAHNRFHDNLDQIAREAHSTTHPIYGGR